MHVYVFAYCGTMKEYVSEMSADKTARRNNGAIIRRHIILKLPYDTALSAMIRKEPLNFCTVGFINGI